MGEAFVMYSQDSKDMLCVFPCCMYHYERSSVIPSKDNATLKGTYNFNPKYATIMPKSPGGIIPGVYKFTLHDDFRIMVANNSSTIIYNSEYTSNDFGSSYIEGASLDYYTIGKVCWGTTGGETVPGYGSYGINITEEEAQKIMGTEIEYNTQHQLYGEINKANLSLRGNTISYDFSAKLWGSAKSSPHKSFNFAVVVSVSLS